jgi:hypothetical protein
LPKYFLGETRLFVFVFKKLDYFESFCFQFFSQTTRLSLFWNYFIECLHLVSPSKNVFPKNIFSTNFFLVSLLIFLWSQKHSVLVRKNSGTILMTLSMPDIRVHVHVHVRDHVRVHIRDHVSVYIYVQDLSRMSTV